MNNNSDITLKPLNGMRGKRHDTLKGCTVEAVIELADYGVNREFHHPVVTLRKVRVLDDGTRHDYDLVTLRYQRHNVHNSDWKYRTARGFLRGERGHWSHCYAAEVRGSLDRVDHLQTGLVLVDRAFDATRKNEKLNLNLAKTEDELLRLIVGLRMVGVTVILRDAKPWNYRHREYSLVAA